MSAVTDAIRQRAENAMRGQFRVVGGVTPGHADEFYAVQGEAGDVLALAPRKADAEFIAHAREDVPRLLAVVSAAQAIIPALDANEPVSERDRAALINAFIDLGEKV